MSNRQLEEADDRRRHVYVAGQLRLPVEDLDGFDYELDEDASDDGVVYGWRVLWNEDAPPGVETFGAPGSLWSDIRPAPEQDESEQE